MTWKPFRQPSVETDATPFSKSLDKVVSKLGASPKSITSVFDSWPQLVGDEIAGRATPLSLVDGVLVVGVTEPRWANQLKWMGSSLMERINEATNAETVKRFEVRVQRPSAPN